MVSKLRHHECAAVLTVSICPKHRSPLPTAHVQRKIKILARYLFAVQQSPHIRIAARRSDFTKDVGPLSKRNPVGSKRNIELVFFTMDISHGKCIAIAGGEVERHLGPIRRAKCVLKFSSN